MLAKSQFGLLRSYNVPSLIQSQITRCFSTTSPALDWLTPKFAEKSKSPKGRPKMHTGGSMRGTTVVHGDYGLRMKDHDRRVAASSLKIGEETIRRRLRGMNYTLYKRVSANIGVYTSGNEMRMGKGKGKFDYWAARIPECGNSSRKAIHQSLESQNWAMESRWTVLKGHDEKFLWK
uniref:54S ribosomal protein L16, mitochondrial n=1 Tax=Talaromyces marneffei PM1 TaxID=1077442 RepID=A0A093XNU7_TALMA